VNDSKSIGVATKFDSHGEGLKELVTREEEIDKADFIGLLASLLSLLVLMIGQVSPDTRLSISGIPLNTLLMLGALVFALLLPMKAPVRNDIVTGFLLLLPLAITLIWSREPLLGGLKLLNTCFSAVVAALLLRAGVERLGLSAVFGLWVAVFWVLLAAAVAYKAVFGFFDRDVRYLVNGPIVFARFMGMAAILCAFVYRGWGRWAAVFVFALAVLWTESKGPLLALTGVGLWYGFRSLTSVGRTWLLAAICIAVALLIVNFELIEKVSVFGRFLIAITVFDVGVTQATYGSIGSRIDLITESISLLVHNPLGVGVGSWASRTGLLWAEYPHNLIVELLCEGGMVFGALALVPYFLFAGSSVRMLIASGWFLFLSQQVSGDLLDSRLLLALSLTAFSLRRQRCSVMVIVP
jgi:hypothetical protein